MLKKQWFVIIKLTLQLKEAKKQKGIGEGLMARLENLEALGAEINEQAVEWSIGKIKTMIGGKYSRSLPEYFTELLEHLKSGRITVTFDKQALISYDDFIEERDNLEDIHKYNYERMDDRYRLTPYGSVIYYTFYNWLISEYPSDDIEFFSHKYNQFYSKKHSMSARLGEGDIFKFLVYDLTENEVYIQAIDKGNELFIFSFKTTPEFLKLRKQELDGFKEFQNQFLDKMF